MRTTFKIAKVVNIIALLCLLAGPYGLIFTGFFQVVAGLFFLMACPKDPLIYVYFSLVALFFIVWNSNIFGWQFLLPASLIFYLTYIIHFSKKIKTKTS